MNKIIATVTAVFLIILASSSPAKADRKTMEGFLIGTGVAILGTAIISELNKDNKVSYSTSHTYNDDYYPEYRHHRKHHKKYRGPKGHWEINRVWIEPVYERKWNPGHYNRRGEWVNGRYEKFLVCKGYWKEEKTWVRHSHRRRWAH